MARRRQSGAGRPGKGRSLGLRGLAARLGPLFVIPVLILTLALIIVAPLWYLATAQTQLYNLLVAALFVVAFSWRLVAWRLEKRRQKKRRRGAPASPSNIGTGEGEAR